MSDCSVCYFEDGGVTFRVRVNMKTGRVDLHLLSGGMLSQGNWVPVSRADEPKNAPKTEALGKR